MRDELVVVAHVGLHGDDVERASAVEQPIESLDLSVAVVHLYLQIQTHNLGLTVEQKKKRSNASYATSMKYRKKQSIDRSISQHALEVERASRGAFV